MNLERHAQIIEIMERQSPIRVKDLAFRIGCTEMTVRRNLDQLQEKGLIQRAHGYATLMRSARSTDYFVEIHENAAQKKAIAHAALQLIQPGSSVCLDSGTTVQQLAQQLSDDFPLSVITPSLTAALTLSPKKEIQVLMPGGFLHHSNRSLLIDDVSELRKYHADIAFLSCRSFQLPGGTFEHSQTLTNTKRALASIAQKKVLLLDFSKWNVNSIFNCIPLEQIDVIITDDQAPQESLLQARQLGKELIVVTG